MTSPGLHYKFGSPGRETVKHGGLLDFLGNYLDARDSGQACEFSFSTLAEHITTIPVERSRDFPLPCGTIQLLSAGDPFSENHQRTVGLGIWERLLHQCHTPPTLPVDEDEPERGSPDGLEFLAQFRTAIAGLANRPDYLLIDLPNGLNDITLQCIQTMADIVVCLFAYHEESRDCIKGVIRTVRELPRSTALVPVLSRVSPAFDERLGPHQQELRDHLELLDHEVLHVVHTDRRTELDESLAFPLSGYPSNTPLVQDFTQLFGYLLAIEDDIAVSDDAVAYHSGRIRDAFEIPDELRVVERVYALFRRDGELVSPDDGARNVAFKAQTFANLLLDLIEAIQARRDVEAALFDAGFHTGSDFGTELAQVWRSSPRGAPETDIERLERWCDFDSEAGFGRFSVRVEEHSEGELRGKVELRNSFLRVLPSRTVTVNLCCLMEGYVKGVLVAILNTGKAGGGDTSCQVDVGHRHEREICTFSFSCTATASEHETIRDPLRITRAS